MLPSIIKFARTNAPTDHDESPLKDTAVDVFSLPETVSSTDDSASLISSLSDQVFSPVDGVKNWDKKKGFSDYVREGLRYLKRDDSNVVMLFESPSTANSECKFFNSQVYKFHDYPPTSSAAKSIVGPCRYSLMNGSSYPSFLASGAPPAGLLEHWEATVPGFVRPTFVSDISDNDQVYAYLPCESITKHINNPYVHYHMAGKDAIRLMTDKTTKLLPTTSSQRPCIVKTTHSMGSKGIFIIRNDEDAAEFEAFLQESGNPTYIVTEFIEIDRNLACHFFVHPNGEIVWFGSNENYREADGKWSMDSYQVMSEQDRLREMQLPFVRDVARYCQSVGFWGFCGIDVLFDKTGKGYLVDVNPRVTGSLPSLMVAQQMQERYGFGYCLFRRNGPNCYYGTAAQLFEEVAEFNEANEGRCKVVLLSVYEVAVADGESPRTKLNVGVYSDSIEECKNVLNRFAKPVVVIA